MEPVARQGDTHACGNSDHGTTTIASGGKAKVDGRPVARMGDSCDCGAVIVQGSSHSTDDGIPIAYLGCATKCGPYSGTITSGSATAKVKP